MNMIVAKLKKRKSELGLSNKELSTLSGVPYGTVCRVLSKMDGTPNLQTLKDLAKALDVSIDDAVGLNEEAEKSASEADSPAAKTAAEEEKVDPKVIAAVIHSYEALLEERQRLLEMKDQALAAKEKWLTRLFIACCVLVGIIAGILIFDLLNPAVGFFRQ